MKSQEASAFQIGGIERVGTDLLVTAKDDEATATRFATLGRADSPEGDGAAAELREPALKLALGGVVGEAGEVDDLGTLAEEGADVTAGIERAGEDAGSSAGVGRRRTRLLEERPEAAGEGESLLQCTARRRWSESLQMEGETAGNLSGGAHLFDLKASTNGGEVGGAEREGLWVVRLEGLIFAAKTEEDWVLEVRRENDALVTSLAGQLYAEVPRHESDEGEGRSVTRVGILGSEIVLCVGVECENGSAEVSGIADVLPCQGGERGAKWGNWGVDWPDQDGLVVELYMTRQLLPLVLSSSPVIVKAVQHIPPASSGPSHRPPPSQSQ